MTIQNATTTPMSMQLMTGAVDRLATQETTIQGEVSSGVLSDSYAGLGDQRYAALSLQPQITEVAAWTSNITSAQNTLSVTQTAMSRITTIATNLQTSLTSLAGTTSASTVTAVALQARQDLTQLASLLNTQSGTEYVFAGNDSTSAPVADPSTIASGTFFQTVAASVATVGTNGAATTEAATVTAASDNGPSASVFSASLSTDATSASALGRSLTVGNQQHVGVGLVATAGGAASATSTGSPIRDLMRALAVVGSLDQADSSSTGFTTLVQDTTTQMTAVSAGLGLEVTSLGQTQNNLTSQTASLGEMSDALVKQLGAVKDSDPASLSTQLTATQNQLQASYSLIADMKGMSLAAYL
ncbi:flagellin [Lichenicola sp.]|uniref:flagellin n=1 Tax=Lichenicola sp. TaxID=2804529 RepID=UPI003B006620